MASSIVAAGQSARRIARLHEALALSVAGMMLPESAVRLFAAVSETTAAEAREIERLIGAHIDAEYDASRRQFGEVLAALATTAERIAAAPVAEDDRE